MSAVPPHPKIFHITHIDNLPSIITTGGLISDAKRLTEGLSCSVVGMSTIKRRRLEEIQVPCYPNTKVGEYVPFYFCSRSIMLYILHRRNHPELSYTGGQEPIIHLQADLTAVMHWADAHQVPWAFSSGNAGAYLTTFYRHPTDLDTLDWAAIAATDFREAEVKEGKQAEFLMFECFPWPLIEKIGVINRTMAIHVTTALAIAEHQPAIAVEPSWYF